MPFAYMVECGDGSLYSGWTTDLETRIWNHNAGKGAAYTRSRLPVRLVYSEELSTKSAAMKREAEFKRLTRKEKLEMIASKS